MAFEPITLLASATQTTTGQSAGLDVGRSGQFLNAIVNVTAASGTTPSMTLKFQWSNDNTNFFDADTTPQTFAALTAVGGAAKQFPILGRYVRVVWTITGTTPSFTFSITAMNY